MTSSQGQELVDSWNSEVVSEKIGFKLATAEEGIALFDDGIDFSESGEQPLNLFSIANNNGYFAASNQKSIIIDKSSKLFEQETQEFVQINGLEGVTQIHFNSDETLVYVLQSGVVKYINVEKYFSESDKNVNILDENASLADAKSISPSPSDPKTLCVLTSSDKLIIVNSNGLKPIKSNVQAYRWSFLGNYLFCTDGNDITAINPIIGQELFKIPGSSNSIEDFSIEENKIIFISEVTPKTFFVVYDKGDASVDDHDIRSFIVTCADSCYQWYDAEITPPYGSAERIPNYFFQPLFDWTQRNFFYFVTSGLATDIGMFRYKSNKISIVTQSEDTDRAQYPIDDDSGDDYSPIGFAIDVTQTMAKSSISHFDTLDKKIFDSESTGGDLPCIWTLCHTGKLIGWWVFNKEDPKADTSTSIGSLDELKLVNDNSVEENDTIRKENDKQDNDIFNRSMNSLGIDTKENDKKIESVGFGGSQAEPKDSSSKNSNIFGENAFGSATSTSSGFGKSGFGSTTTTSSGFGKTGFGFSDSNTVSKPTSGFGSSGFGQSGSGSTTTTSSGFGKTGFGFSDSNTASKPTSGFGSSGFAQSSSGKSGFGSTTTTSSGFGKTGFGLTDSNTVSKPTSGFGQSGFGSATTTSSVFGSNSTFGKQEKSIQNSPFARISSSDKGSSPFGESSGSDSNSPFSNVLNKTAGSIFDISDSPFAKIGDTKEEYKANDSPFANLNKQFKSEQEESKVEQPKKSDTPFSNVLDKHMTSESDSLKTFESPFANLSSKKEKTRLTEPKTTDSPFSNLFNKQTQLTPEEPKMSSPFSNLFTNKSQEPQETKYVEKIEDKKPGDQKDENEKLENRKAEDEKTEDEKTEDEKVEDEKAEDSKGETEGVVEVVDENFKERSENESQENPEKIIFSKTTNKNGFDDKNTLKPHMEDISVEPNKSDSEEGNISEKAYIPVPKFDKHDIDDKISNVKIDNFSSESILSNDTEESLVRDTLSTFEQHVPPAPPTYFIYDGLASPLNKSGSQIETKIQEIYNDTTGYLHILDKNFKTLINYIDQQDKEVDIENIYESLEYPLLWSLFMAKNLDSVLSTLSPDVNDILQESRAQESKLKKLTKSIESNQTSKILIDKLLSQLALISDSSTLNSSKDRSLDLQNELLQTSLRQKLNRVRKLEKELIAKLMPLKAKLSNNDNIVQNLEKVIYQINTTLYHKMDSIDKLTKDIGQLSIENKSPSIRSKETNSKIDMSNSAKWKLGSIYDSRQITPKKVSL